MRLLLHAALDALDEADDGTKRRALRAGGAARRRPPEPYLYLSEMAAPTTRLRLRVSPGRTAHRARRPLRRRLEGACQRRARARSRERGRRRPPGAAARPRPERHLARLGARRAGQGGRATRPGRPRRSAASRDWTNPTPAAVMSTAIDTEQFRQRMLEERQRVVDAIDNIHAENPGSIGDETEETIFQDNHLGDIATATFDREMASTLEDNSTHVLAEIDAALAANRRGDVRALRRGAGSPSTPSASRRCRGRRSASRTSGNRNEADRAGPQERVQAGIPHGRDRADLGRRALARRAAGALGGSRCGRGRGGRRRPVDEARRRERGRRSTTRSGCSARSRSTTSRTRGSPSASSRARPQR